MSTSVTDRIEVDCPISTVYNQWTQFEEFPRFMGGVESIRQLDDRTLHWIVSIGGVTREWDARIVDQEPDQRIAWENTSGATNRGVVSFRPLDATRTEVNLELEFEGEGFVEKVGEKLGLVEGQAKADLERFKEFMEARQLETGGWRGDVDETGTPGQTGAAELGAMGLRPEAAGEQYIPGTEDPTGGQGRL